MGLVHLPVKVFGSTPMLKAHMKIFPSIRVTRIQTMGANRDLWSMAENRNLRRYPVESLY